MPSNSFCDANAHHISYSSAISLTTTTLAEMEDSEERITSDSVPPDLAFVPTRTSTDSYSPLLDANSGGTGAADMSIEVCMGNVHLNIDVRVAFSRPENSWRSSHQSIQDFLQTHHSRAPMTLLHRFNTHVHAGLSQTDEASSVPPPLLGEPPDTPFPPLNNSIRAIHIDHRRAKEDWDQTIYPFAVSPSRNTTLPTLAIGAHVYHARLYGNGQIANLLTISNHYAVFDIKFNNIGYKHPTFIVTFICPIGSFKLPLLWKLKYGYEVVKAKMNKSPVLSLLVADQAGLFTSTEPEDHILVLRSAIHIATASDIYEVYK